MSGKTMRQGARASAATPALNVKVASLFTVAGSKIQALGNGKYGSRWATSDSHPVAGATLTVVGQGSIKAIKTGPFGGGRLDLSPLKPGTYVLRLEPAPANALRADPKDLGVVGPADGTTTDKPGTCRFRPLEIDITVGSKGDVTSASSRNAWGNALAESAFSLVLDWKPDWIAAALHRPRTHKLSFVIVHRTADTGKDPKPGSALGQFADKKASIHYLADVDGHLIKLVVEGDVAAHAGESYWDGKVGMSESSVGIEQVNADDATSFPKVQIDAVRDLVKRIRAAHGLTRHAVLGHGEVRVLNAKQFKFLLKDRPGCPGVFFDWEAIGKAGEATYANPAHFKAADIDQKYNQLFKDQPSFVLGDKAIGKTDAAFVDAKKVPYGVIASVQVKLAALGYSVSAGDGKTVASAAAVTGKHDLALASALDRFRRRYMPFGTVKSNTKLDGIFDRATAIAIERALVDRTKP